MIAPDEKTFEWVRGRDAAPEDFDAAVERWRSLSTEDGATFDSEVEIDAAGLSPMVTWGTTLGMVVEVTDSVPIRLRSIPPPIASRRSGHSPTWRWSRGRR